MSAKRIALVLGLLAATLLVAVLARQPVAALLAGDDYYSVKGFAAYPLPLKETDRLFDIGVVDADGDGRLDIYTSNHHFRQTLLLADGKGGYRDVLSDWGLDQSAFPRAELSFVAPKPEAPGVYLYWLGTDFVVQAHRIAELGPWKGSMRVFSAVEVMSSTGIGAEPKQTKVGEVVEATVAFSSAGDGTLVLRPGGQGVPLEFEFGGAIEPVNLFVGMARISPKSTAFSLAMRDRHALAWSDYNGDGVMDIFINRGALSGTLRAYPPQVADGIRDELLVSRGPGSFEERGLQAGLQKNGCSGRHAQWVDFDGDGWLDLFVNCYDRENYAGDYPKQLYRRQPDGDLRDVAEELGLGLPEQQMANVAWADVAGDGDMDLLAFQDEGLFLYRQDGGRFVREVVFGRAAAEVPKIGRGRGNYWFYDGKFSVADYDGDGLVDAFSSSKRGNVLLRNHGGKLEAVDLAAAGLPAKSTTASWVDYDNDGRPDLHLVPQGLYRQRPEGTFEATGLLAVPAERYDAAIINWLDLDNDGRLDVVMALDENPEFRRWWEFRRQPKKRGRWQVVALRNTSASGHWLQVVLAGRDGNREGIGATVTVVAGGAKRSQVVGAAEGSFFSQGHYRLYFGLGDSRTADLVKVRWPDGVEQELRDVTADRLLLVERSGTGDRGRGEAQGQREKAHQ